MKKLPITIQSFKKISTDTFIYIDKTEHIYNLTKDIGYYFLSPQRRSGKSLLIDTIHSLFESREGNIKRFICRNRIF